MKICKIATCNKPHYALGWCNPHWAKNRKYGDPLAGKNRASKGEPFAWILKHVTHQDDKCLIWPFAKNSQGYGDLWLENIHLRANRLMCELAHGPAPSPTQETLHKCGMGHLSCINPKHLRWGTSKENSADTILHGKSPRGESKPNAKLTRYDVLKIRKLLSTNEPQHKIAKRFGICQKTVCDIKRLKLWGWL